MSAERAPQGPTVGGTHPPDFYAVLGVKRTASRNEIRDAFKKLTSHYHPDRNKDEEAAQRFKEVSEAYFVLSDPAQRRLYDAARKDGHL